MRKIVAGIFVIILLITSELTTTYAAPSTGQTPSGIPYTELDEQINQYIDTRKDTTSSVSLTYFNETEDITSVIYGDANTREGVKADENTVYEWGSISKMLIWTSVMQLYEQGKLDLHTDIRNYLPDGFLTNLSFDKPVTMLHLMNHTAGFQETTWDVEVTDKADIVSLKDALLTTAPPQIYEPDSVCSYSNWGAALAAYIVECISGMDYADYVHQNIFEPLDMEQTFIRPDGSDNEWVEAQREQTNAYYNVQGQYEDYGSCRRYILLYPAGSATGTMSDLVRFAKAFLMEGDDCPLFSNPDTLSLMLSPSLTYDGTHTPRICHGLFWQEYGVNLIGHAGNTTGFTANLMLDTNGKTGLVVMTNEVGETTYNYGLVSLIFGDCATQTDFTYDDLSGIYCNSRANYSKSFMKLFSVISGLFPVSKGETPNSFQVALVGELTQISKNACVMDDGNGMKTYLSIKRDEKGNIIALQNMTGTDLLKENTIFFFLKIIFFLLFVLASFWMLIMFVVHGVTLWKFKKTTLWKNKLFQFFAELLMVLTSTFVYWLILPLLLGQGSLVKEQIMWKGMLIILCTVSEFAVLLLGWWKGKATGPNKSFMITNICGVLLIASVLYWRFYQFWGC